MKDRTISLPKEETIKKISVTDKITNLLKKKDYTSKQISKITQMSIGTINNTAVRMEIKGTITKTKCSTCGTGVLLHLTKN